MGKTQFVGEVDVRSISLLVKDFSRVLQKLPKYLNGAAISAFFLLLSTRVLLVILTLNFNDLE